LGLAVGLLAGGVWAQAGNAKVAPFPIQLRQGPADFGPSALTNFRADFVKLLRDSGVATPATFELNSALERTQRQDCDVEDQCLSAYALRANALYGVFVLLEWNLKDAVTASGRVVRQDGQLAVPKKSVTLKFTNKEGFAGAAKLAVKQLVMEELKLQSLPAAKATAVAVEPSLPVDAGVPGAVVAPAPPDAGSELPPPPPPPVVDQGPPVRKIIGYGAAGAGGVAAVAGLAVFLGGRSTASEQLDERGRLLPEGNRQSLQAASGQQTVGVGVMCAGVAVATVGVILVLLPGDEVKSTTTWWVAPTPGGAAVGVQGVLP
jgi:hypothetical protein